MTTQLSEQEVRDGLAGLDGWDARDGALHRVIEFDGYRPAVAFVVRVAMEAEKANHHPDLALTWGRVEISLTSHDAGGITTRDLELARTIDALPR